MIEKLDITGKVCPFCLLSVDKKLKSMPDDSTLVVLCDHAPAATGSIPEYVTEKKWQLESKLVKNGVWELTIKKGKSSNKKN